jgi:hypothetical protein
MGKTEKKLAQYKIDPIYQSQITGRERKIVSLCLYKANNSLSSSFVSSFISSRTHTKTFTDWYLLSEFWRIEGENSLSNLFICLISNCVTLSTFAFCSSLPFLHFFPSLWHASLPFLVCLLHPHTLLCHRTCEVMRSIFIVSFEGTRTQEKKLFDREAWKQQSIDELVIRR